MLYKKGIIGLLIVVTVIMAVNGYLFYQNKMTGYYVEKNLEIIMSSPKFSSSPGDYIKEHQKEFGSIVGMGENALKYMLEQFKEMDEKGLKGHIMARACIGILGKRNQVEWYETGEDWYNQHMKSLHNSSHSEKTSVSRRVDLTYDSFIEELKTANYKIVVVEPAVNEVKHTFFSVYPKYIDVGKERVSIYEFDNPSTAGDQAKTISNDGYSIGNAEISWVDTPHFFVKGNLIVGYIGNDKKLLGELEKILGCPVTKH